jgi:hypothetical protein
MPTASFILGYEFKSDYLELSPRSVKRDINDTVLQAIITAFTKTHRKVWLEFPILFDFLTLEEAKREIQSRIRSMDYYELTELSGQEFIDVASTDAWTAHYQPISTIEHRVTTIAPLWVYKPGFTGEPVKVRDLEIEAEYKNRRGREQTVKAAVIARLTWGIDLPPGEREGPPLPPPHGRPLEPPIFG